MKITSAPVDILAQVRAIASQADVAQVAQTSAAGSGLSAVEQQVLRALQGHFLDASEVRGAIANALISSQLRGMPDSEQIGDLAQNLLLDDPVFSDLVDQTILLTARELLEH